MIHQGLVRLGSAAFYGALYSFVLLSIGVVMSLMASRFGLHTVVRTGDVEVVLALLVVGVPLFAWGALRLYGLGGAGRPTLVDHFSHCATLYPIVLGAAVWLPLHYAQLGYGLSYAWAALLAVVAVVGVLVDAVVLRHQRRVVAAASLAAPRECPDATENAA
ncbi:MAG: hypothetical protein AAFX85_02120 [Pseudomonadota bacterium]